MGDPAMVLGDAELRRIGEYVKGNLKEWLVEVEPARAPDPVTNTMLMERIVRTDDRFVALQERTIRIEEELKSQRELMQERFTFVEQRFEIQDKLISERFAASDRRYEDLRSSMDKRFTAVDKRFEDMQASMDKRFTAVDKRFEDMQASMDKRFALLTWMIGIVIASGLSTIGILLAM